MMDFTNPDTLKDHTDGELFYIIKNGHNEMPAEGPRVKTEEAWDRVNYVRGFAKKKEADKKVKEDALRKAKMDAEARKEAEEKTKEEYKAKKEADKKVKEDAERKTRMDAEARKEADKKAKEDAKNGIKNPSPDKIVGKDDKGRTIYEGPRGGRYYINSNGNKEYIKNKGN